MKCIYLTDVTTNLNQSLLEEANIFEISKGKSLYGQILYSIDTLLNSDFDLVYFASNEEYKKIITLADKVLKIHSTKHILIINIESDFIGKNNIVYRLATSNNIYDTIKEYKLQSSELYDFENCYSSDAVVAH